MKTETLAREIRDYNSQSYGLFTIILREAKSADGALRVANALIADASLHVVEDYQNELTAYVCRDKSYLTINSYGDMIAYTQCDEVIETKLF